MNFNEPQKRMFQYSLFIFIILERNLNNKSKYFNILFPPLPLYWQGSAPTGDPSTYALSFNNIIFPYYIMPAKKKNYLKKPFKVIKKAYKKATKKTYTNKLSNGVFLTNKQVFPDRLKCSMTTDFKGFIPYLPTARQNFLISILANNIYQPGNTMSGAPSNSSMFQVVTPLTGGASFATQQPGGYTQLASIYKRYRVISASIIISIQPETAYDTMFLGCNAVTQLQQVAVGYVGTSGLVNPNASIQSQFPRSKSVTVQPGSGKPAKIYMNYTTANVNGITDLQFKAQLDQYVAIATTPDLSGGQVSGGLPWWYMITIGCADNINFSSNVIVNISLRQNVELIQEQSGAQ